MDLNISPCYQINFPDNYIITTVPLYQTQILSFSRDEWGSPTVTGGHDMTCGAEWQATAKPSKSQLSSFHQ